MYVLSNRDENVVRLRCSNTSRWQDVVFTKAARITEGSPQNTGTDRSLCNTGQPTKSLFAESYRPFQLTHAWCNYTQDRTHLFSIIATSYGCQLDQLCSVSNQWRHQYQQLFQMSWRC